SVRDIALQRYGAAAAVDDLLGDRTALLEGPTDNRDGRAFGTECQRDAATDTLTGPGDERHATSEGHGTARRAPAA
ncbi:MAG: hypothetical protein QOE84_524, partial [Actinomycetota bacterium]|nr:hypothetical protein [Actinomycetota bacterium]